MLRKKKTILKPLIISWKLIAERLASVNGDFTDLKSGDPKYPSVDLLEGLDPRDIHVKLSTKTPEYEIYYVTTKDYEYCEDPQILIILAWNIRESKYQAQAKVNLYYTDVELSNIYMNPITGSILFVIYAREDDRIEVITGTGIFRYLLYK